MTQMDLNKYLHKRGKLIIKDQINIEVVIEDCKITYGKLRMKVKPTHYDYNNSGSMWVDYMHSVNGRMIEYESKDIRLEVNLN